MKQLLIFLKKLAPYPTVKFLKNGNSMKDSKNWEIKPRIFWYYLEIFFKIISKVFGVMLFVSLIALFNISFSILDGKV